MPKEPARRLSVTIGIARVMCILGIVYVHAWTGLGGDALMRMNDTGQGMLRWALIELLGRSAVPLLSIISGWLVAASLTRQGWRPFLAGKVRTILVPMVMWNAIAILLVSGAAWAGWISAPIPRTWWWTIDELLCLVTPDDINVQMSFLRDLFICMLAAPMLMRLPNWVLGVIATVALAWAISVFTFVLLVRPSILLFFIIGIIARRRDLAVWMASQPIILIGTAYIAFAALQIWLEVVGMDRGINHPMLLTTVDLLMRFTTALFFWAIAWRLAASRAARPLLAIEPYAFLMFCAHLIMMWLGGPLIGRLTGPLGSPLYPAFLLSQPVLVLAATLLLGLSLKTIAPTAAMWLSGGRLSSSLHAKRTLRPVSLPQAN